MKRRLNYKIPAGTNRALKRAGLVWRTASLALTLLLACGHAAHAIIIAGDPPPPQCSLSASLSANPSSIDRNTSLSVSSKLTWLVEVPPHCTMSLGLYLAGANRPVGKSGELSLDVLRTTTYALKALLLPGQPTLASATVTVSGDPGLITVSPGPSITADDLSKFNAQWMQPAQRQVAYE